MLFDGENDGPAGTKPFWLSKTMWGAGFGILGMVAAAAGFQLDADTQKLLIDQSYAFVSAAFALGGTVLVVVGRFKANQAVTAKKG